MATGKEKKEKFLLIILLEVIMNFNCKFPLVKDLMSLFLQHPEQSDHTINDKH